MASDIHLKVTGAKLIEGESLTTGHEKEIELLSWGWNESQSAGAIGTGGKGAGRVSMNDLTVSMEASAATVPLALACATGEHLPEVVLTLSKAGGSQETFYTITLTNAFVSSFHTGASAGTDKPIDSVTFSYKEIEWLYKPQAATGATGEAISSKFSLETFK